MAYQKRIGLPLLLSFRAAGNPVSLLDRDGRLPYDAFDTPAQAAHDFGKNYNSISMTIQKEISTPILKYIDANGQTRYTYAVPNYFDDPHGYNGANAEYSLFDANKYEKVGDAHTHGHNADDKINPNNFSDGDKNKADCMLYLITPGGHLKSYDPKTGEIRKITTDMPRDAGSRKANFKNVKRNPENRPIPLLESWPFKKMINDFIEEYK